MMKDETKKSFITEFVGIKPKVYNFLTLDMKNKKICKGISRSVV